MFCDRNEYHQIQHIYNVQTIIFHLIFQTTFHFSHYLRIYQEPWREILQNPPLT